MLKIDQLPTEVLMKIFGYLRSYGNVSLVSRRFYDVACSVHDSVSISSIFRENGNHQSVMESVQNTRRKISKLSIRRVYVTDSLRKSTISDVVEIVKKFSATIKHFELRHVRMEMSDFLEMLSSLPNAEHLMFYGVSAFQRPTDRQLSSECLNLHRLETLELRECSDEFIAVFNRLPAGVLKKLTITHFDTLSWDSLADLFTQQSNIKQLVLDGYYGGTLRDHIFDHLKLESLEFNQREYNSSLVLSILSKQTKLIRLRLRGGEADDQTLKVITNQLSELETLDIRVDEAQVVPFKRIEKLKKLNHLTLQTRSVKIIETFAGLDNSRITTLDMKGLYTTEIMPVDVIAALANSLPNLKVLRFDNFKYECQTIAAVMQHFNFVEVLEMTFDPRIDAIVLCQTIEVDRCFNPKLTELKIETFPCDEPVLTKLAAVYPNLKKLDLRLSRRMDISLSLFKAVLTGFKEMESLHLEVVEWSFSTEYVECITEHKNKLKSITLVGFYSEDSVFTVEHVHKLSAVFDVLKYHNRTLHLSN